MRKHLFIFSFFLSVISYSQNWNVFNKAYRYNYKFDNSALISNVLFADTVKQTGTDTTYIMNNIGVVTGNTLTINKPQFLMKKIVKLANGNVSLLDTTNIIIIPTCTLNQSWLFDSNYNLTATCVSTSTQTIFNITDSIKTIIVNNVDSVILSKQFGIIMFPKFYSQNKYYKLVGIENKNSYDSIPLFGVKVPNAWDVYKFDVGDKCNYSLSYVYGSPPTSAGCQKMSRVFNSRAIVPNGYSYTVYETSMTRHATVLPWGRQNDCEPWTPSQYQPSVVSSNTILTISNLNDPSLDVNKMYPGMTYGTTSPLGYGGIVTFGLDNSSTFYKYLGTSCQSSSPTILPSTNTIGGGLWYGVGLGKIGDNPNLFEGIYQYCVTSFIKGSVVYFGPYGTVSINENTHTKETMLFPNPANTKLTLPLKGQVKFYDAFGKLVLSETFENTIDVSLLPNGLYFIEIQTDSFKSSQKLIIQH